MAASSQQTSDADDGGDALPVGTVLLRGSYQLTAFIASGGFGKTYLAKDNLERVVVIKECFPSAICFRKGASVVPMSRTSEEEFRTLVGLFKTEARNLSKLSHPNIVKVHQVFDDNGTAYMVLDHVNGQDLASILKEPKKRLNPEIVTSLANKLIDAVTTIHSANVLHRDISPDNILIDENNEPVLIDFGAARQLALATSRKLSEMRMVKDGYSPQEFYSASDEMHFASDLYSLAASLHHAIVGYPPPNAQERVLSVGSGNVDLYRPIALQARGYEPGLLAAIDRALELFPIDRPQNAKEWRQLQKGQRIPNRSNRRRNDVSEDLIKKLMQDENAGPAEPEVNEALRALRALRGLGTSPVETKAGRSPKLYASLTLLAGLTATSVYLNATSTAPLLSVDLRGVGLTGTVQRAHAGSTVTFSDGAVFSLYEQGGKPVTWVASAPTRSASALLRGDIVVHRLPDRTPVSSPQHLSKLILDAQRQGLRSINFAIWRDGALIAVPFDISDPTFSPKS